MPLEKRTNEIANISAANFARGEDVTKSSLRPTAKITVKAATRFSPILSMSQSLKKLMAKIRVIKKATPAIVGIGMLWALRLSG